MLKKRWSGFGLTSLTSSGGLAVHPTEPSHEIVMAKLYHVHTTVEPNITRARVIIRGEPRIHEKPDQICTFSLRSSSTLNEEARKAWLGTTSNVSLSLWAGSAFLIALIKHFTCRIQLRLSKRAYYRAHTNMPVYSVSRDKVIPLYM